MRGRFSFVRPPPSSPRGMRIPVTPVTERAGRSSYGPIIDTDTKACPANRREDETMTKTFAIAAAIAAGLAFAGVSAAKADPCHNYGYTTYNYVKTYVPRTYTYVTTHVVPVYNTYSTYNVGY